MKKMWEVRAGDWGDAYVLYLECSGLLFFSMGFRSSKEKEKIQKEDFLYGII